MKNQSGTVYEALLVFTAYIAFFIAVVYGWIANVLSIVHGDFAHLDGLLVARVIGVFVAPLGAVLGYF